LRILTVLSVCTRKKGEKKELKNLSTPKKLTPKIPSDEKLLEPGSAILIKSTERLHHATS
jgi:hypothetical protein